MASLSKYHGYCCTFPTELFVHYLYFKSHRIVFPMLLHFAFPLSLINWVRNFNFFPSQAGLYFFLLVVCFPQPLKIIFLYCRHLSHFSLLYNILIPFPPLLNFIQLLLPSTLLWFFCNFSAVGPLPFQFLFKPHGILIPFVALFLPLPFHIYLYLKFCSLPLFASVISLFLLILLLLSIQKHFPLLVISYTLSPIIFLVFLHLY